MDREINAQKYNYSWGKPVTLSGSTFYTRPTYKTLHPALNILKLKHYDFIFSFDICTKHMCDYRRLCSVLFALNKWEVNIIDICEYIGGQEI